MYNLRKDLIFTLSAQAAIMIVGLFINKYLSTHLTIEDFGIYNILKRSATVLGFTFLCGMGIALPKFIPLSNSTEERGNIVGGALSIIFSLIIFCIIIIAFFSEKLSVFLFSESNSTLVWLTAFYGVGICLTSYLFSFYRAFDKHKKFSLSQIFVQFLILIGTVFFAKNLVTYIILISIMQILYFLVFFTREYLEVFKLKIFDIRSKIKILSTYGISRLVGDFILFSMAALPVILMNHKFGLTQSSYFSVATTLNSIITPFFSYIGVILLPKVSTAIRDGKFGEINRIIDKFIILFLIVSFLIIFSLFVLGNFYIHIFFSEKYLPALEIVKFVSLSIIPHSVYLLLRNPIDAVDNKPYNTYNLVIVSIVLVVLLSISKDIYMASIMYSIAYSLLGGLSYITWIRVKNRKLNDYHE